MLVVVPPANTNILILILIVAVAMILTQSSSHWMICRLAQILGRMMK